MPKFTFKVPKKKSKKERREAKALPSDTVALMFELYCKEYSRKEIAREAGVSVSTVSKYINKGYTDLYEPFKVRRARIIAAATSVQDGKLLQRLSAYQSFGGQYLNAMGQRMLSRVEASKALDNPALWQDEENLTRDLLERIAYEPDPKDVESAMKMNTHLLELALRTTGALEERAGVQVNVQQNNNASASSESSAASEASARALDAAHDFLDNAGKKVAGVAAVADMVKEASLASEREEYAAEGGGGVGETPTQE